MRMRFWSTIAHHRQPSITWSALPAQDPQILPIEQGMGVVLLRVVEGFCRKFSFEMIWGMISPHDSWEQERGRETMAVSFKGAHFPQEIILPCVRWYVSSSREI